VKRKVLTRLVGGTLFLGTLAGLGGYQARATQTTTPPTAVAQATQKAAPAADLAGREVQHPSYAGSLRVLNAQDVEEAHGPDREAAEDAALRSLARVSPEQARTSAL
jgi:hypothetical protein